MMVLHDIHGRLEANVLGVFSDLLVTHLTSGSSQFHKVPSHHMILKLKPFTYTDYFVNSLNI